MRVESWIEPDEAPALAATATAMIDAALVGTELSRDTFWAAVRKGYNTPYNDPAPRLRSEIAPVTITVEPEPLPVAVMAAANAAEARAV